MVDAFFDALASAKSMDVEETFRNAYSYWVDRGKNAREAAGRALAAATGCTYLDDVAAHAKTFADLVSLRVENERLRTEVERMGFEYAKTIDVVSQERDDLNVEVHRLRAQLAAAVEGWLYDDMKAEIWKLREELDAVTRERNAARAQLATDYEEGK